MGRWVYVDQDDVHDNMVHVQLKEGSFVFTVTGNAMEPEYYDGDKVLVKQCKELEFGEVGVFQVGQEYLLREYGPEGLYAKNPNYQVIPADGCRVIGLVIEKEL